MCKKEKINKTDIFTGIKMPVFLAYSVNPNAQKITNANCNVASKIIPITMLPAEYAI